MIAMYSYLHIARFVIEADTAFAIASGLSDGAFDALVVRDANNLPAIPGTSLAGVLRSQYQQAHGEEATEDLFGYTRHYETQEGQASRVQLSWGCVHDSHDVPVEGIHHALSQDPLLDRLAQDHPVTRERVKLNHRGAADDGKKFDKTLIPAGCRFSVEMSLWSASGDESQWQQLLDIVAGSALRIGGSVRSGLGKFSLKRLHSRQFKLNDKKDYQAFRQLPAGLGDVAGLTPFKESQRKAAGLSVDICLQPEDYWRVGQGTESLKPQPGEITPQALPVTEPSIVWEGERASFVPRKVVVPGSGVKGALRHRLAFHYQRICKHHDVTLASSEVDELAGVRALFGFAADTQEAQSKGQVGAIFFSDIYPDNAARPENIARMSHTSIDRFTGGVRDGVLFVEELMWQQPLKLTLWFDSQRLEAVDEHCRKALKLTLDDLVQGRLALGAASSKGHGFFGSDKSGLTWSDGEVWIKGGAL